MRALLAIVTVLALLWGGYWVVGSRALERSATGWFAGQAAAGQDASYGTLTVRGFPSRFDLTVEQPRFANSTTGFGWSAPFAQVFSLSYKPWHVIFALPNDQTFETPIEQVTLVSTKLQGSVVAEPTPSLALDRITLVGEGLKARSSLGWQLGAESLRLATRQSGARDNAHQIGLDITAFAPDPALIAALAGQSALPATFDTFHIEAELGLDGPLDRSFAQTRPSVTSLSLTATSLRWGNLHLTGTGGVTADANGYAEGEIALTLENWREALPIAIATGLIAVDVLPTWENALEILAAQSGAPNTLSLPLSFRNGRMSLGPLPLGPAPRLN